MTASRDLVYGGLELSPAPGRQRLVVAFGVMVAVAFNVVKPVHIDDALYLSIAEQIRRAPLDPYGFVINWQHTDQPAYKISISPPMLSYYLALWMTLGFGDGFWLHLAMAPWFVLLGWSVSALLSRAGPHHGLGALFLLCGPAVLAGANLMLDVPMTACLTAGVECLLRGLDRRSIRWLLLAGIAGAAAVLIKYPALAFAPICLCLAILRRERKALIPAAFCLGAFLGWQAWSAIIYGAGQVQQATSFLERFHGEGGRKTLERLIQQFVLLGAAFPIWIVTAVSGQSRIWGAAIAAAGAGLGLTLLVDCGAWQSDRWSSTCFLIALFLGAFSIGELLVTAFRRPGGELSMRWTALVWVFGVVGVSTVSAPFVAVRYLLPALPALLYLQFAWLRPNRGGLIAMSAASGLLGVAIAVADLRWAAFYPRTVAEIRHAQPNSATFFAGHWGLQWYATKAGMSSWSQDRLDAQSGWVFVVPQRADPTPIHPLVLSNAEGIREFALPPAPMRISIWRPARRHEIGVCFYGWEFPHLPWGFSSEPAERIAVLLVQ